MTWGYTIHLAITWSAKVAHPMLCETRSYRMPCKICKTSGTLFNYQFVPGWHRGSKSSRGSCPSAKTCGKPKGVQSGARSTAERVPGAGGVLRPNLAHVGNKPYRLSLLYPLLVGSSVRRLLRALAMLHVAGSSFALNTRTLICCL